MRVWNPAHGGAGVDEEGDVEVLLVLEEFDEKAVETAVDVPVDGAEIVAGGVVAVVGEFEAGAGLAGAALGAVRAAEKFFREEVELFEFGEKGGVEKRQGGGFHGGVVGSLPGGRVVGTLVGMRVGG